MSIKFTNNVDIGEYLFLVGPTGPGISDADRKVVNQSYLQTYAIEAASGSILSGNNNWSGTNTFAREVTINGGLIATSTITSLDIYATTIYASNIVNTVGNIGAPTVNATNVNTINLSATMITGINVRTNDLNADWITGTNIQSTNLTATNVSADWITGTNIQSTNLTATNVSADWITGTNIQSTNLTATNVSADWITGTNIQSTNISVSSILKTPEIKTDKIGHSSSIAGNNAITIDSGQNIEFVNVPSSARPPIKDNDLTTKAYVDSVTPVTSYLLYLNKTDTFGTTGATGSEFSLLSPIQNILPPLDISSSTSCDISNNQYLIGGFYNTISTLQFGTSIPAGVWVLRFYTGCPTINDAEHTVIMFELYKDTTLIATSANSDLISTYPGIGSYSTEITAPLIDLSGNTVIGIKMYAKSNEDNRVITTYYQSSSHYTTLQTPTTVQVATNILSTNNIWSGSNQFNQTIEGTVASSIQIQTTATDASNLYPLFVDNTITGYKSLYTDIVAPNISYNANTGVLNANINATTITSQNIHANTITGVKTIDLTFTDDTVQEFFNIIYSGTTGPQSTLRSGGLRYQRSNNTLNVNVTNAYNVVGGNITGKSIYANAIYANTITGATSIATPLLRATNITGTNITADFIGVTGIVARDIRATNITAHFMGVTGIVATNITGTNITTDFIGATGIVAKNITGTNITADFIGVTEIVATNITGNNITATTGTLTTNNDAFIAGRRIGKGGMESRSILLGSGLIGKSGTSTGDDNVLIGNDTGATLVGGTDNTLVGASSGTALNSGSYNTFIGRKSGGDIVNTDFNTCIGYNSRCISSITNGTAIGANSYCTNSSTVELGTATTNVNCPNTLSANFIGATTIVATNITGTNITAEGNIVQKGTTTTIKQEDISYNTSITGPNQLRSTNIYGNLKLLRPTDGNTNNNGGSITLMDVTQSLISNYSQILHSGKILTINNRTNEGTITLKTTNSNNTLGDTLSISSDDMTIKTTNPPTQNAVQPLSNDRSTKIPTTDWVQDAITNIDTTNIRAFWITGANINSESIISKNITAENITADFIGVTGIVTKGIHVSVPAGPGYTPALLLSKGTGANKLTIFVDPGDINYIDSKCPNNKLIFRNDPEDTPLISIFQGPITATSFNTSSDYRIKQFIQSLPTQYNVDSLKPVQYYNTSANKTDLGFIAHEVEEHFPMLVNGVKDGPTTQSINYIGLIPVLVSEVKELKSQIKILKEQLQTIIDMRL